MATVVSVSANEVTVSTTVRLEGSLMEMEVAIREAVNEVGACATEEALKRFDADGSPIRIGDTKLTSRGCDRKLYQTPYGEVEVERHVYQTSRGGRIYCPLEDRGRIVRGATPMFASQLSHKYAHQNVRAVQRDLEQNHGRKVAASYIQHVAEWVGSIAEAKEEQWEYELPQLPGGIATVAVSLDGAMIPMAGGEGYREAMAGDAVVLRLAQRRRRDSTPSIRPPRRSTASRRSASAWTYFGNHRHQMDYPGFPGEGLPIGSGVAEAACKTLVKQRLCASGMRWKDKGARIVLSLRALTQTLGRWAQFWQKIDQFGAACA
jgi:hypothetical protein